MTERNIKGWPFDETVLSLSWWSPDSTKINYNTYNINSLLKVVMCLNEKIDGLEERLKELETAWKYRPLGEEYSKAQSSFNNNTTKLAGL